MRRDPPALTAIKRVTPQDVGPWAAMRHALWPFESEDSLAFTGAQALGQGLEKYAAWLAYDGETVIGFAEASVRHDYVNGCETSPVAFLEGIYVEPDHRWKGVAQALVTEIEAWAKALSLTELASDALLENTGSHAMHTGVGFEETERVVYFRKVLGPHDDPHRPSHPPRLA